MRTFDGIRKLAQKWAATGFKNAKFQKFMCCKAEPVISGDFDICDLIAPAPLHLLLGITNKLVDLLQESFPQTKEWLEGLHVLRRAHNNQFKGGDCRQVKIILCIAYPLLNRS